MKKEHLEVKFERHFRRLNVDGQRELLLLLHDIHIKSMDAITNKTVMEGKQNVR